eukprot:gene12864-biopygen18522
MVQICPDCVRSNLEQICRYGADLPRSAPDGDGHDLGRSGSWYGSGANQGRSGQILVRMEENRADLGTDLGQICPDRFFPGVGHDMGRSAKKNTAQIWGGGSTPLCPQIQMRSVGNVRQSARYGNI